MNSTRTAAELLNDENVLQVVFTKTARSNNALWVLNRNENSSDTRRWNLLDMRDMRDQQFAGMSTEKAIRVVAKHFSTLVATGFTREDFNRSRGI